MFISAYIVNIVLLTFFVFNKHIENMFAGHLDVLTDALWRSFTPHHLVSV